jgi:hypothetical protein
MVGYVYGKNMVTGVLSVIKSDDFQTAAVSGVGYQLAETALGQFGMLQLAQDVVTASLLGLADTFRSGM